MQIGVIGFGYIIFLKVNRFIFLNSSFTILNFGIGFTRNLYGTTNFDIIKSAIKYYSKACYLSHGIFDERLFLVMDSLKSMST